MANRTDREMLHAIIEIIEAHNLNFPHLVKDIRARLTEPEDEPVAYRHLMDDGWEYFDAPTGEDCEGCQKLYRHPSRQLVGLSDEEIENLFEENPIGKSPRIAIARAIEKAVLEKNQ